MLPEGQSLRVGVEGSGINEKVEIGGNEGGKGTTIGIGKLEY